MFRERDINKFLNGRHFLIMATVLFVIASVVANFSAKNLLLQGSANGTCFHSIYGVNISEYLSAAMEIAGLLVVGVLLSLLNKYFSFIRDVTYIYAPSFLLLCVTFPYMLTHAYDGMMLSVITLFLAGIVFSTYQSPYPQRRVFLTCVILSTCCMFQYAFVYLIPVIIVGFIQMRAMTMRSAMAMFFGFVTPFWIALGTGIVTLDSFLSPVYSNVWSGIDNADMKYIVALVVTIVVLTIVLIGVNVLQIINYKMQVRAYNGFFLVLSVCTIIVMAIDYTNVLVYLPMLNVCLAIQIAHLFSTKKYLRRYIPYLLFVASCIGIFVWRVFYLEV